MAAWARDGEALSALPCYLGDSTKELTRLSEPLEGEGVDLWLMVNHDTQQMARVRIVMEFLTARLTQLTPQGEGESGRRIIAVSYTHSRATEHVLGPV